jgi:formylglycine-generating enzyme required for sulfatase activity
MKTGTRHFVNGRLLLIVFDSLLLAAVMGAGPPRDEGMVLVPGGTFQMGDIFGEGAAHEKPVHQVQVDSFSMAKTEVTVAQFGAFVEATGYRTSAEHPDNPDGFQKEFSMERPKTMAERLRLHYQVLAASDGAGVWDVDRNRWVGYRSGVYWKAPGFEQGDQEPVVAVSCDDAMNYCNWLSRRHGLPAAYDVKNRKLLDADGNQTTDIRKVKGFRLPTEAEWEFAAREGGRDVRFGTGNKVAKSSEIVFRADAGTYSYLEPGLNRKKTLPVGSLVANRLGLYDMSGNAWEWTSDDYGPYDSSPQRNPYVVSQDEHPQKVLRGGRWGGDAAEARVFSRAPFLANDRCNNSGFRVARTAE